MDVDEENVDLLKGMGFPIEAHIRQALKACKNDVGEAVDYLTQPMNFISDSSPPSYSNALHMECAPKKEDNMEEEPEDFPVANLFELEDRVFTDSWSIPFRRDESLGKCLLAARKLAEKEEAESNVHCERFLSKCLPDCFTKLMNASAVHRWTPEIQQGIYQMVELFVDFISVRLKYLPLPVLHLKTLALIFDPINEYNWKNRYKEPDVALFNGKLAVGKFYAAVKDSDNLASQYGWLTNVINQFGCAQGFHILQEKLADTQISLVDKASLFSPIASCSSLLNVSVLLPMFEKCLQTTLDQILRLDPSNFKEKNSMEVCQLLHSMKMISYSFNSNVDSGKLDQVRLDTVFAMLRSPHFNARMNALKEILRLIEDHKHSAQRCNSGQRPNSAQRSNYVAAIPTEKLNAWLYDNKVLAQALEGNIDQAQYCEKVRGLMQHLSRRLSLEEISAVWALQGLHTDNVHWMIEAAAIGMLPEQTDHMLKLIHETWNSADLTLRCKLLKLLGRIGTNTDKEFICTDVLELVWKFAHQPGLDDSLLEESLRQHQSILVEASAVKFSLNSNYAYLCLEDIKNTRWVLPALNHLLSISRNISSHTLHKQKGLLSELNKSYDIVNVIVTSLEYHHQMAVKVAVDRGTKLTADTVLSSGSHHSELVQAHLALLKCILQDGILYLSWNHTASLWRTLVTNPDSCEWDEQTAACWFVECIADLENDTQDNLFVKEILKMDPAKITISGFSCYVKYFESVNLYLHKLRKPHLSVENLELVGLEFAWQVCLYAEDSKIGDAAIAHLITFFFANLSPKLLKNVGSLHQKLIEQCYARLEYALLSDSLVSETMLRATITCIAPTVPHAAAVEPSSKFRQRSSISRLLQFAQEYILTVEKRCHFLDNLPSHAASFHATPLLLHLNCDASKASFSLQVHANTSIKSLRSMVAREMGVEFTDVQFVWRDTDINCDQRLLYQLEVRNNDEIGIKLGHPPSISITPITVTEEKSLPSVQMARNSLVFNMLFRLAELGMSDIVEKARNLLLLIPTDPSVLEKFEHFAQQERLVDELSFLFEVNEFQLLYHLEALSSCLMPANQSEVPECKALVPISFAAAAAPLSSRSSHQSAAGVFGSSRASFCDSTTSRLSLLRALISCGMLKWLCKLLNPQSASCNSSIWHLIFFNCLQILHYIIKVLHEDQLKHCKVSTDWLPLLFNLTQLSSCAAVGKLFVTSSIPSDTSMESIPPATTEVGTSGSGGSSGSDHDSLRRDSSSFSYHTLSDEHVLIACESQKLLTSCLLSFPSLLVDWSAARGASTYLHDSLLASSSLVVRQCAVVEFTRLSRISVASQWLLTQLVQTRLPFWVPSTATRGVIYRLIRNCQQYFQLRATLTENLPFKTQQLQQLNVKQMLEDEMNWLHAFQASDSRQVLDNCLLACHLRLISALLSCEAVDKQHYGELLLPTLLNNLLFSGSASFLEETNFLRCCSPESRQAALDLLTLLAYDRSNHRHISSQLIKLHHSTLPCLPSEWDFLPAVDPRAESGYVGLKNGGATCYMNAVLQQIFMTPGLAPAILTISQATPNSVLYELQVVLAHLSDLLLQYYVPRDFWATFKLWGQKVNIREQQDAFDFFQALIDQVNDDIKKIGAEDILQNQFEGKFSDEKVCQDCPHRYKREEIFYAINVTVKCANLHDSLTQFFKGEVLEGDNAYFCEKCSKKRTAIRRSCIQILPRTLFIQLKRFGYDWENNQALKFDDHFQFPWTINMAPYSDDTVSADLHYQLVGVVVHSGKAHAGHYYSFIKERRTEDVTDANKNIWFKFNDQTVEQVELNEEIMEKEFFGGTYQVKGDGTLPEQRMRYWSAYLLIYERMEEMKTPAKKPKIMRPSISDSASWRQDSLAELSQLIDKGEQRGLFSEKMPSVIESIVRQSNLLYLRNRDVFCRQYFQFIYDIVNVSSDDSGTSAIQLASHFLFFTYGHTKLKLRTDMPNWQKLFGKMLSQSQESCKWFIGFLGQHRNKLLKPFLIECPNEDIRIFFQIMLQELFTAFYDHGEDPKNPEFDKIIVDLLDMFSEISEHWKTTHQFYNLLLYYACLNGSACCHLFQHDAFCRLVKLFVPSKEEEATDFSKRSLHARDASPVFSFLAQLVLNTNVTARHTIDGSREYHPFENQPSLLQELNPQMDSFLFKEILFIQEVVSQVANAGSCLENVEKMLLYCSFSNQHFSFNLLSCVIALCSQIATAKLKFILQLLLKILKLEDSFSGMRANFIINGSEENPGLLSLVQSWHKNDPRRSYQSIKLLVAASKESDHVQKLLLASADQWQWSVDWLKSCMMYDQSWKPSSVSSNEDASSRSFQRTVSAQRTLDDATAMLSESSIPVTVMLKD